MAEDDEQSVKNIIDAILLDFLPNNLALRNPMILVWNEFGTSASRVSGLELVAVSEGFKRDFRVGKTGGTGRDDCNRTTSFYG